MDFHSLSGYPFGSTMNAMKTIIGKIVIIALCLIYGGVDAADEIMPVDQIRPGMIGVGKTVFKGTEISEFTAEILGVLRNSLGPKRDLILARLSGGPLEITHNVIAGMSGSPVYIDGKMIGAVAYGWSFAKEPICGITPIGDMIGVFSRGLEEKGSSSIDEGGQGSRGGRINIGGALASSLKG
ncbi:MAG: hypothetical protein HY709_03180, partial [Candidatus Latescibacteria bacterium]|nr:hypothetical protein [Candidatus Latescibacterota bacterium]